MAEFHHTIINTYAQALIRTFLDKNCELQDLLSPFEDVMKIINEPGGRIKMEDMTKLWLHLAKLTKNPDLGLHVGQNLRPGSFHTLFPVIMNCNTISSAVKHTVKYQELVSQGGLLKWKDSSKGMTIEYRPVAFPVPMTRHQIECIFSGVVNMSRLLMSIDLKPVEITFNYDINHSPNEYHRIFKCPVKFGKNANTISISKEDMMLKIPHADPELLKYYSKTADQLLKNLKKGYQTSLKLKEWLYLQKNIRKITLSNAAAFLKQGERTLQRQLHNEKTTFHEILNSVLMERAHRLLRYTDKSISEIAEELGYMNDSSFQRGFRKWFSIPPARYRKMKNKQ